MSVTWAVATRRVSLGTAKCKLHSLRLPLRIPLALMLLALAFNPIYPSNSTRVRAPSRRTALRRCVTRLLALLCLMHGSTGLCCGYGSGVHTRASRWLWRSARRCAKGVHARHQVGRAGCGWCAPRCVLNEAGAGRSVAGATRCSESPNPLAPPIPLWSPDCSLAPHENNSD
jgi:hypothetical protein